jgi:hypothetical protein
MTLVLALALLAALALWTLCAIGVAFLTGGMIHERDEHDRPFGGGRHSERAARRHAFN